MGSVDAGGACAEAGIEPKIINATTNLVTFSGIFFPLDRLPGWVQGVAWFIPLRQAVNLMRALILNGDIGAAAASALWIAVLTGALLVVPMNLLRRRLVK